MTTSHFRPIFVEYTGFTNYTFGCGGCPDGDLDVNCTQCTGSADAACNTHPVVAKSFMCYDFTYNADKKVFAHKADPTTCQRKNGTDIVCNRSVKSSYDNYETLLILA